MKTKKSAEKNTANEFSKLIIEINKDLIKKHFWFQSLIDIQKQLKKKIQNKIKKIVQFIESRLSGLEKKNISENEKEFNSQMK